VSGQMVSSNGRFAIDPDQLFLFSSKNAAMMPGAFPYASSSPPTSQHHHLRQPVLRTHARRPRPLITRAGGIAVRTIRIQVPRLLTFALHPWCTGA
jgi:hypothetical protein